MLIANPNAWGDDAKRRAIEDLTILLKGTIDARGRVLVKLNVERSRLDAVVATLPAMRAPTISELAEADYFAVETVVPKSAINTLIPELKGLGAEDIVELPITKIVH